MLRTTKWKFEKPKVKVVFRLQFHATNIPQSGWEKLFVCFVPTESGKITAKTSKANVRNGTCKWADPIYETTRLLVDSRNKRYDDKFYKLIVGMGTSHASILGEAIINLADFADASDPFVVALPLHGSDHGTILHVTVQLLTGKTGFREFEQQFDRGLQSNNNLNREVEPSFASPSSPELQILDANGNKVDVRTHFGSESTELFSVPEETIMHEDSSYSQAERDGSSSASESNYADKRDSSSIHESRDYSTNNDLVIAHEENRKLRGSLETAESFIIELKQELNTLHSHANELGMETQRITQHLTNEISSGVKLEREIMILKSECSKFKDELQQLKEIKIRSKQDLEIGTIQEPRFSRGFDLGESQNLKLLSQLDEAKAERGNLIKKMNEMECYYEALVQELEENREQILGEFQRLRYEHSTCIYTISNCKSETESIRHCMKDQILKFEKERHAFTCVNEELEERVIAAEALVQELEENREKILRELQSLKNEHSTCADTISSCKSETESIRRDMKNQTQKFGKEKHALGCVNEELNKKVMAAESLVQELEKKRERILGEFRSLKSEHSTCANTFSTFKTEAESTRHDMKDQILKLSKERNDLDLANQELEKRVLAADALVKELKEIREQSVGEIECLRNEHAACADTISTCRAETESIRRDMKDQILKFEKERHVVGCASDLKKRVMVAEALVQEVEKDREQILGEYQSLIKEHSACADTILACRTETESIRHDMNDQILKLTGENNALGCANEELEQRVMNAESLVNEFKKKQELLFCEFQSLKNEHLTCGDTILTCKSESESIRHDMNNQISRLAEERNTFGFVKEELEKRVTTAEALVQEFEEYRDLILGEFQSLKDEHSTCAIAISTCKAEAESVRCDMNDQIVKLTEERHALSCVNKDLEKKVVTLESALERARVNYTTAVTRLQKDLEMLSSQVSSMFETNQNLIKETFSEASTPLSQNHSSKTEIEKQLVGGDALSDDELYEIYCANLYLEVYSVTLQERLFEASIDANKMKEQINEFARKANEKREHAGQSESLRIVFMKEQCETAVQELKQQLFVSKRHGDDILIKLQDALNEIESRKKSEASYLKKIEELSLKIVGLEADLESIQAELDCALLNLECCKEEKEKVVSLLQEKEKVGLSFQDIQRELEQLHKVNEDLGEIYPNFKDFPGDGNPLERVLALEIELAESLKAKNSSIQFQSSFLKQHSDEEAVLKSFRDINELIKDTLETKSKYVNVETELNEMHERYSQLSLQFAEVEGERQKLMMSLKNVRSPRNLAHMNRSSSGTLDDNLL
ncbi:EEIG1/EHBP1 N-terminal domain-containing protein [Artemisia annua]|uniref:EEIG1/EHBP1 N-terminal domain-containing protein n=1 Tax=Artemisia annua TaxID=35608 RepID=A0A2U1Q5S6_ARTAN|nr:EEIG1/EHBP1 N-terminal domain-containing protein [Artemisia annua]